MEMPLMSTQETQAILTPLAAFHGTPIEVGDIFRASQAFTNADYTFQEVNAYAFTEKSGNSTVNLTLSGTVENVVTQLNAVSGISAKLVKTTSDWY